MLVLSRKENEKFTIGDDIEITVVRVGRGTVRIGVNAPRDMRILRDDAKDTDGRRVA